MCPTLLPVELAGAVSRVRGDAVLAQQLADVVVSLPGIRWVSLDDSLSQHAARLAADHRLRGADAVYAAVADVH